MTVFDGIQWYCNTLAQPRGNTQIKFWIPENTINTVTRIHGIVNRTHFYSQYHEIPSATVGNHMGTHQNIPLDTFGNPEYSNYPVCIAVWQTWRGRAIWIWIYRQLLSNTQVNDGIWVLPTSNTECTQIPYGKWAFRGQVPLYFTGFQKRQRNKVVQKWRHASCLFTCASALWLPEESKGHIHPQGWGWVHCNVMKSSSPDQIFLISVSKTDY